MSQEHVQSVFISWVCPFKKKQEYEKEEGRQKAAFSR